MRLQTRPADALRWRHATLDLARERATQLGLAGAAFPWRTIRGHECSGYWPAGTAAFHINGDIADAVIRYSVRDRRRDVRARGRPRAAGGDSPTVALARASRRRRGASASTASRVPTSTAPSPTTTSTPTCSHSGTCAPRPTQWRAIPASAAALGVDPEEAAAWRDAAERHGDPVGRRARRAPAIGGLHRHQVWDFEHTRPEQYPLLLHFPYFDLYRKQVVKQADLVLAMHICRRRVQRRGEGEELRLLRGTHRERLVAVRLHPGGRSSRGRTPRAGLRLLRRGRADRPARPRAKHASTDSISPRWPAP